MRVIKYIFFTLLIFLLVDAKISVVNAFYGDTEKANSQELSANSLDISIRDIPGNIINASLFSEENVQPNQSVSKSVLLVKEGSLDFKYKLQAQTDNYAFCNVLKLKVKEDGTSVFEGPINNLSYDSSNDQMDSRHIEFSLVFDEQNAKYYEQTCVFSISFFAWQVDSDGTWGFTDNEQITNNTIKSGLWITDPQFDMIYPNGGEHFKPGDLINITWNNDSGNPFIDNINDIQVVISLNLGPGYSAGHEIAFFAPNTGSFEWEVPSNSPELINDNLKIVIGLTGPSILTQIESDNFFSIDTDYENPPVVINEVMWMGSKDSSADEWIELKNNTDTNIDLTGWVIKNAATSSGNITLLGQIEANGYYLISNYNSNASAISNSINSDLVDSSLSLNNDGNELILKNKTGNTIDKTPTGEWVAGTNSDTKNSMERNNDPKEGANTANWHTCIDDACNNDTYWDTNDGDNYGTPKSENHSKNDKSVQKNKEKEKSKPVDKPKEDIKLEDNNTIMPEQIPEVEEVIPNLEASVSLNIKNTSENIIEENKTGTEETKEPENNDTKNSKQDETEDLVNPI
ncbi:hypothetical protein COV24_02680 [candidate division WWE3 bacterium CG10_big_fil_rev_8_21_14_0_10_32_10]|uniref:LTD domain-containing protein n=1 Tax=candidate division WWE3 bacterium CG10_big_fil_rev_8_21_14_0_10_32_10 TaxID=1975090 RepID=A0A2H0RA67_UNCKA|nr:MAG: hypothetical protein COV24_02680 [candidate division WWE3 bacterium CG10_big_fil_rev_8_21_14_0_10_32_10]